MKKITFFLSALLFSMMSFAAEIVAHELVPAKGTNNTYAGNCDVVVNGVTWNITGNSTMLPWRIGGKSITNQDRALYSKNAIPANITKIEVAHGTIDNITVNSAKLIISDEADGDGTEVAFTASADTTTTITLPEGDNSNKFYKFVYNLTVAVDNNKFVQFSGAKFYTEVADDATKYTITATVNDDKMGKVTGVGEYVEGVTATLNAVANPGYEFVKWEDNSTENPRTVIVDANKEVAATFQAQTPITIAEAMLLVKDASFVLNQFTVIQYQGGNTYIKDANGYGVIFKYDLGLNAGDVVASMPCTKGEYYNFAQFVPLVSKDEVTVSTGELPTPELFTTAPVATDIYKYVKLDTVTVKSGALLLKDSTSIKYYNATLTEGKKYNIVGSVGHYKGTLQIIVATSELLPGQEDTETPGEGEEPGEGETPGEGEEPGEGETPVSKVTFDFTTAAGLEALGIAYPATETTTEGAFCTDLEEGKAYTQDGVSLTVKHGSTATRVWLAASGAMDLRHYKTGVLTFTAPATKVITSIVFDGDKLVGFATLTDNAWTGNASTVEIPAADGAETIKIKTITISLADAAADYVAAPTIAGETNFLDSTVVTITAEEGLKVYYTVDGTEPTNASTEYTAPFQLTATATVKAIAYKGDKASAVVEKTFTKMFILTCKEAVALCTATSTTEKYIIRGYVTELLDGGYSEQYKNITFWMADTQDGGQVLQAFRVKPVSEVEKGLQVGDFVEVTGTLVLYSKDGVETPEVNAGGTVKLIQKTAVDNINVNQNITKTILNGQLIIIKNGVYYNAQGQVIK